MFFIQMIFFLVSENLFNKSLLGIYYVQGILLGAAVFEMTKLYM